MNVNHQHAIIYSSTPKIVESHLNSSYSKTDRNDFISALVHKLVQSDANKQTSLIDSLRHQQLIIGTNSKNIHQFSRRKRKHISHKANKLLSKTIHKVRHNGKQLRDQTSNPTKYEDYFFMNDLWKQYIRELLKGATSNEAILQRIVSADFHGCLVRVAKSKNTTLVNREGIIIQETKNAFVIVEKSKNRRCVILKKDCLFSIDLSIDDKQQTIFLSGAAIAVRPELRGQKRSTSIEYMHDFC